MLLSVAVLISCCFYVLAAGESEQIVWQRDEKKVAITFDWREGRTKSRADLPYE